MADLIFYGVKEGKNAGRVFGPYHPDEMRARASCVRALRGEDVYMIYAETYEQARRKLVNIR
jgi:hypothetical protein